MSSKREQQRQIREQKQQAAARKARIRKMTTGIAMVVLVPLVLIAIVYGFIGQGQVYPPDQVGERDHVRGNPDGAVLVVYADFQCPACAREAQLINQAWPRISNNAQLVFRHYPITDSHAHAWTAALYAEAAGLQGHFWEMHDVIFANQTYWSRLSQVNEEFDGYLRDLGLDVEQAHADIRSEQVIQKVRNDQRGGTRAGVRATPTLFVNGRQTSIPRNVPDMVSLVNRAAAD